ncbi:hypothetical protein [Amycolatopsis australiensis]|uniref:hypothetical protein n=1 Tax=Amycolatopsis australiensis TaxID=546364 RepID=UPI0011610897|nr:hypothetical protein [Amycolatopsis australiensis]
MASVFEGAFDLDAVQAISHHAGLDEADVQTLLIALVSKNIIKGLQRRGRPCYRMLETIRQYGPARSSSVAGSTKTFACSPQGWPATVATRAWTRWRHCRWRHGSR